MDKALRIAFDSWVLANRFRYHGTQIYAQRLMAEFKQVTEARPDVECCLFTPPDATRPTATVNSAERFALVATPLLKHDKLWRLGGLSRAAFQAKADLIFTPAPSALLIGKIPAVCAVHDVLPVIMPTHSLKVNLLQRALLWSAARSARAIITVSECSRNDLIRIYGVPESKVSVVYNGCDHEVFTDVPADPALHKNLLSQLEVTRPYILHHGTIQPRKNLRRLIQAYRLLCSRSPGFPFDLVLAGGLGWNYQEVLSEAARSTGDGSRVVFTGALDITNLALLVKGADLVVIPSLYEGFCLPMVEAMACGAPVITANRSCLPEVSGGVLKYFDPYSIDDMAACVQQVLESEDLKTGLATDGKKRAALFTWSRCAQQTLAVLQNAHQLC